MKRLFNDAGIMAGDNDSLQNIFQRLFYNGQIFLV